MSVTTTNQSAVGNVVSSETALACFFRLGAQNGVYAEVGAVRRRNLIEGDTLPVARLVELAGEFGLRAERVRFDWEGLRNTPFSHPILLLLDNKNAVVLVGVRRNGPEEVAVSDPVFRDGEPFFLAREDLERAWGGAALVVTPLPPTKADTAFGFSWFTTKLFAERRLMRDIVVAALWQNTSGQAAIWLLNNAAPFDESVVGGNPGPSWQVIGAGDFNGDGDADILWQNTNGQAAIWLMNGATPFSEQVVGANPGPSWHVVDAGDFNGDGDADILWQNTNGQAAIWLMNGTTPLSETVIGNPGPSWHIVGTGDFNGDGDADILWQNTNGQASIWLMNGTTPTFEGLVGSNPGPTWHIHAAS